MGNYKELLVWQKSVHFVTEIYTCTKNLPKEEIYALTNQIRRSSVLNAQRYYYKVTIQP